MKSNFRLMANLLVVISPVVVRASGPVVRVRQRVAVTVAASISRAAAVAVPGGGGCACGGCGGCGCSGGDHEDENLWILSRSFPKLETNLDDPLTQCQVSQNTEKKDTT